MEAADNEHINEGEPVPHMAVLGRGSRVLEEI
jgi:hypothetical protein